jgi:alcohol dehydrogenase
MVHDIEAFTFKRLKNPLLEMLGCEALRLINSSLERTVADGSDVEARSNMLLDAIIAGQAFANAAVG